jgi:uncharacterized repeat protein (TIGR03803 family)
MHMSHRRTAFRVTGVGHLALALLFTLAAGAAYAQSYKVLANTGSTGSLIQGPNGDLYGTGVATGTSGPYGNGGSVFNMTAAGTMTTVYPFCSLPGCADGSSPTGLVLGSDGNFYGTTRIGGANSTIDCSGETAQSCGTVFKLTPSGELTTLYSFCSLVNCADGSLPASALVQGLNGNFYGITSFGGTGTCPNYDGFQPVGCGTIFMITPTGTLTTLYSFCAVSCTNGWDVIGSLLLDPNGKFYGTSNYGGTGSGSVECNDGCGTLFEFTSSTKSLTSLYSFCIPQGCPDGARPQASMVLANGVFYGTTAVGGAGNQGTVFSYKGSGTPSVLYSFCTVSGCPDGDDPQGIMPASDGNFYGTTASGGANQGGTLFKVTPAGGLTTLYSFCQQADCFDGIAPNVTPVQATNGVIYGAADGGNPGNGVIYEWAAGLKRFVKTVPSVGVGGTEVIILGNGLTGASAVSFGGTAAKFAVVQPTEIKAIVPAGAPSGYVRVTTSTGAVLSTVTPFFVP